MDNISSDYGPRLQVSARSFFVPAGVAFSLFLITFATDEEIYNRPNTVSAVDEFINWYKLNN